MILFDTEQTESANGFPQFRGKAVGRRSALPTQQTLTRYLKEMREALGLSGEVSVLLTTDKGIRGLNRRFRRKDKATDVLSFPVDDSEPVFSDGSAGDLAISVDTAARQAQEQGHALSVELRILMMHGLLHLAGYDHETDDGAMDRTERLLRERYRLPQGLIERVESSSSKAKAPVSAARRSPGLTPPAPSEKTSPIAKRVKKAAE